jgi:probable rRNA maturation factor
VIRVSVVDAAGRAVRAPGLARWLARVAPPRATGEVTVALISDARMRALNRHYRKRDYPTDVLSFTGMGNTSEESPWPSRTRTPRRRATARGLRHVQPTLSLSKGGGGAPLGDIAIAKGVAARQARANGHPLPTELKILALHGLLHLLGYDHETDTGQMAELERRLRRKGGLIQGLTERGRASRG